MDNPTRWNITNSAQNIVSALADPSKQFDSVFRREWGNTFACFTKPKLAVKGKDNELRARLSQYINKLNDRQHLKTYSTATGSGQSDGRANLGTIPAIFMVEDFDLSNPDVFTKVMIAGQRRFNENDYSGQGDDIFHYGSFFTKNQLKELQLSFTDYLDVTEERLASQISNRSGDFFQVMSSVDCVTDELSLAIKSVTSLRKKCSKLNEAMIVPNMRSIHLNKARNNALSVLDKMNEISYLCKVQPTIQILLAASDFVGALDLIAKSRAMLHKDLNRVVSLRHLESQLVEIERMIGTMMQQEFLTLISSEWDGLLGQQSSAASRLSKLFDYFAEGYSELPERGNLTLLSLLQIQAEKFVNQFHEERKKRIESILDMEQWKVIEVPHDFQRLISLLVDEGFNIGDIFSSELANSQSSQPNSLSMDQSIISRPVPTTINGLTDVSDGPKVNGTEKESLSSEVFGLETSGKQITTEKLMHVQASDSSYVIVNSVMNLVRTIMDYCKCAHEIKSLSADLLERLFKILHLFNSKTYHLVYSAGAIQIAGLKTITTRSLVISQRSLRLIILLLPAIHRHFTFLLPGDKRLKRFEEIKTSYEEHAAKIPERVRIMVKDIIDLQLKDWEAKPPVPSTQFNAVTQHLTRLHDNIQDALPIVELRALFVDITETFKEVLITHLRRLEITNDSGPQQWLVTQELTFYKMSFSKLRALRGLDLDFGDLWTRLNANMSEHESKLPTDSSHMQN